MLDSSLLGQRQFGCLWAGCVRSSLPQVPSFHTACWHFLPVPQSFWILKPRRKCRVTGTAGGGPRDSSCLFLLIYLLRRYPQSEDQFSQLSALFKINKNVIRTVRVVCSHNSVCIPFLSAHLSSRLMPLIAEVSSPRP